MSFRKHLQQDGKFLLLELTRGGVNSLLMVDANEAERVLKRYEATGKLPPESVGTVLWQGEGKIPQAIRDAFS